MIEEAKYFAFEKHKDQIRKFTGNPYHTHPFRVADIVRQCTDKEDLIVAALLHDTIEDTQTTYDEIKERFNERVANLVMELTNNEDKIEEIGKEVYLAEKMNKMSEYALLIKLADRLDNISELTGETDDFSRFYRQETNFIMRRIKRSLSDSHKILAGKIKEISESYV